jgi:hypothetical protein
MFSKIQKFWDMFFKCHSVSNCCNKRTRYTIHYTHYITRCNSCSKIYKLTSWDKKQLSPSYNLKNIEKEVKLNEELFNHYFCVNCNK